MTPGEEEVEHDEVEGEREAEGETFLAVLRDVGGVASLAKGLGDRAPELGLVLDDQDPHRDGG